VAKGLRPDFRPSRDLKPRQLIERYPPRVHPFVATSLLGKAIPSVDSAVWTEVQALGHSGGGSGLPSPDRGQSQRVVEDPEDVGESGSETTRRTRLELAASYSS